MLKEKDCSMPTALEAIVLNLMVFNLTGERLYSGETYTRCLEKAVGGPSIVVGGFTSEGLDVNYNDEAFAKGRGKGLGVACTKRF